jgi:hypothetical protein
MVEKSTESRFARVKKFNVYNEDSYSSNDIVCTGDFEELTAVFKDDPNIPKKIKLLRKK